MTEGNNTTEGLKLYSQKAIGIATFLGGPIAGAYLIRGNYRSLGESQKGMKTLVLGVVSTILLFVGIFSIPEAIIEKIPNMLFPAIYVGVIYLIVEKNHGAILKQHKEKENEFQSIWKAVGIGVVSMAVLILGVLAYTFYGVDNELYKNYEQEMTLFSENEDKGLAFYSTIDFEERIPLIEELDNSIIPTWEENIKIIERINNYKNLPKELVDQNVLLMEYSELRLKAMKVLRKAFVADTDEYANELDEIHIEIERVLEELNTN